MLSFTGRFRQPQVVIAVDATQWQVQGPSGKQYVLKHAKAPHPVTVSTATRMRMLSRTDQRVLSRIIKRTTVLFLVAPAWPEPVASLLVQFLRRLGAKQVMPISKPWACWHHIPGEVLPPAAIIFELQSQQLEISLMMNGACTVTHTLPIGYLHWEQALQTYLHRHHQLLISPRQATACRHTWAIAAAPEQVVTLMGYHAVTGQKISVALTAAERMEAGGGVLRQWFDAISHIMYQTPVDWVETLKEYGLYQVGTGEEMPGLQAAISQETDLCVTLIPSPVSTVLNQTAQWIQESKLNHVGRTLNQCCPA